MMDTAAGLYAHAIFPDALSKTAPHLSDLQKAMLDATPDCIKVVSVDGRLLMMNRAGCIALNVPEDSDFGMPWLPLLPADVHPRGLEALREAAQGRSARFPGKSVSPDGTRYWDNLLTPLVDGSGQVLSILCVSRDVTAKTRLESELQDSINRERLLSREMQHRIKNLFSLVSGLIFIAEKEAAKRDAQATGILREKLGALARASDAAFSPASEGGAAGQVDLQACIGSVLKPYGERCVFAGDRVWIDGDITTTFALFLHELATNSIKYGALGTVDGKVEVRWAQNGDSLTVTWTEDGGPQISGSPNRQGFGSEMIDRIVRSAGGKVERIWNAAGLTVVLEIPNPSGK